MIEMLVELAAHLPLTLLLLGRARPLEQELAPLKSRTLLY